MINTSPNTAQYSTNGSSTGVNDLQFMTTIHHSPQNVPIPPVPTLNNNQQSQPQQEQQPSYISRLLESSAHPTTCIFHVLFKALAIITYLFGGLFQHSLNFITVTVCCILLLAIDFWVVKNITGRLLVGLRWWAQVDLDGNADETRWIFESKENVKINSFDQTLFWTVLYTTPIVWGGFLIVGLMKFNFGWLITVSFGIASNCANVYGYWQCSKDQKAKFQQMMERGAQMGAVNAMKYNLFGKMASFATSFGSATGAGGNSQQSTQV
mmetsp:Transcript_9433/g.10980  ORF Transcript_9433/g.10980 Transcript_9433/m.10980 type:complete len:267 (+) Transcript_9433:91-891(+)